MHRRVATWALVTLGLLSSACVPPPPEQNLERTYSEDTTMGALQDAGRMRIGIAADAPPLGYVDPRTEEPLGFTVALGRELAETLGVRPAFMSGSPERLLELLASEELDIAFPNVPLTEEAVRTHTFSTPYLLVHQRLMVPSSSTVRALEDLAGQRVCSAIDPATGVPPTAIEPRVRVRRAESVGDCIEPFRSGAVAAATGPDVFLRHTVDVLAPRTPAKTVGDELSTSGYGAAVTPGGGWLPFVNAVLGAAELDGTWTEAYTRWIGPNPGAPPELTAEEAAALFPSTGAQ
jgi:polar amino acid transport system substrate-binding protein